MILAAVLLAATAPAPPAQATEVSPVTVVPAGEPPKVVSSYPAAGGAVKPGVLVLKLTFDQKMLKTGFDIAAAEGGQAPACLKTPRLLNDGKSFVLLCTTAPGAKYALALNSGAKGGFANIGETRAARTELSFTTTDTDPVRSIPEAMKVEGLGELEAPVDETPGHP